MAAFLVGDGFIREVLNSLPDTLLWPTWLRLFTNVTLPPADASYYTFLEAAFTGYSPIELTDSWEDAFKVQEGLWGIPADNGEFSATVADTIPITGYWITNGTDPLFWGMFDSPWVPSPGSPLVFPVALLLTTSG